MNESELSYNPPETPEVTAFLEIMNARLANDYSTPDGRHAESCTLIACDVARKFLAAGRRPYLMSIRSEGGGSLKPLRYAGRVRWGGHVVCGCDGYIYDPMVGRPISEEAYAGEAFDMPIAMKVDVAPDEIEEFVSRGERKEPSN